MAAEVCRALATSVSRYAAAPPFIKLTSSSWNAAASALKHGIHCCTSEQLCDLDGHIIGRRRDEACR